MPFTILSRPNPLTPNVPSFDYNPTAAQRGTVSGKARTADGTNMDSATIILSTFDPVAYSTSPVSQEYQRRAAGYNYWVTPNKDGTFTMPDVRPGTYRVTIIKPGNFRETTFDNITVTAGGTTSVGNLTFNPDIGGKGIWQVGTFDRTAGEFRDGNNYNNWIDTFNESKEFPNGVSYTVDNSNPFNDTQNWRNNWGLDQINGSNDFWKVNFKLPFVPAANATFTVTVAIAAQEFIDDIGILIGSHRVDASFDHTADTAPSVNRSGDTSSKVLYRKLSFPASWLANNTTTLNTLNFHIVGGEMQWDALRLDVTNPGTMSSSQWNGASGNWSDATQWKTRAYGYSTGLTTDNFGTTTFADGATGIAPINNTTSQVYYDAIINGGTVTLDTSPAVQRLDLLEGTLTATGGTRTITANDVLVLGGATVTGTAVINALSLTTVNFNNTISAGAQVLSTGAVTMLDGGNMTVDGAGSQWTVPGLSFGQVGSTNSVTVSSGGTLAAGANAITVGPQGTLSNTAGTVTAASLTNSGTLTSTGTITLTGIFTNSGTATISGTLNASSVSNTAGLLILNGTSNTTGGTSITGGAVQFGSAASIGGSGRKYRRRTRWCGQLCSWHHGPHLPLPHQYHIHGRIGADIHRCRNHPRLYCLTSRTLRQHGHRSHRKRHLHRHLHPRGKHLSPRRRWWNADLLARHHRHCRGHHRKHRLQRHRHPKRRQQLHRRHDHQQHHPLHRGTRHRRREQRHRRFSNVAANLVINGGTLQYTGAAASTDRLFTFGSTGATFDGSGTGAINFNNTASTVASGTGNRMVTLTGTTAGNIFAPGLADPSTGTTALTKTATGTWSLGAGLKTYSGDTTVLNGTLQLASGGASPQRHRQRKSRPRHRRYLQYQRPIPLHQRPQRRTGRPHHRHQSQWLGRPQWPRRRLAHQLRRSSNGHHRQWQCCRTLLRCHRRCHQPRQDRFRHSNPLRRQHLLRHHHHQRRNTPGWYRRHAQQPRTRRWRLPRKTRRRHHH